MLEPPRETNTLATAEPRHAGGGSAQAKRPQKESYYRKVYSKKNLRNAWHIVYENGITSKSEETRKQVKKFSLDAETHLSRIARQLKEGRFKFPPSEGILSKRPGKKPRPIVKSPIESRIVQRAILDILQTEAALDKYYKNPTSFGGIKGAGLGVPGAIRAACKAIEVGCTYFIRSDIEGFFTKIPRTIVLNKIKNIIGDPKFNALLEKAMNTELENLSWLGKGAEHFPLHDIGVAQGCCLSPLIGNILLEEFDKQLNGRGIVCLRYIDDFIILGPKKSKVLTAFNNARLHLAQFGLTPYDPNIDRQKAEMGEIKDGIEFLGCNIFPGVVRPNRKSRASLLETIRVIFEKSASAMFDPRVLAREGLSVAETLIEVDHVMKGWGNQYFFCNDPMLLSSLDAEVDELIAIYWENFIRMRERFRKPEYQAHRRRLLGVHLLIDSKSDPIIVPKTG